MECLKRNVLVSLRRVLREGNPNDPRVKKITEIMETNSIYERLHPIRAYKPILATRSGGPHQLSFHCASNEGRGAFGGNQSGKTQCGSKEASFAFCDEYPDWYPQAQRFPRRNKGRIVVKDFQKSVAEVIEPSLMEAIPDRYIADRRTNNKGYLVKLVSKTGASFDIVSHEMETKSLEGWQGDWAWFDEPPPRDKWVATLRGLVRRRGRWWLTCTPLDEPWMYDEIYTNSEYFLINIDMRDNPYLSEDAIARYEEKLTEEEREARIHGRFMHLAGLTYKEFDPSIHIKRNITIPPDWPRWCVCDPHGQRPFAFMWFAMDPMNRMWIYDEWPRGWFHEMKSSKYGLRDYSNILHEIEIGQRVYRRVIDGRAGKAPLLVGSTDGQKQDTLIDALQEVGLTFEPSYITLTTGIADPGHLKVKEMLRVSPVTNEPSLFVLDHCKNTVYAFQHNTWASDNSQGVARETQSQFAKDFLDLIRYGLMDDPHWVEFQPDQTQPHWAERNQAGAEGSRGYGNITDY